MLSVRDATVEDVPRLLEIYEYYVNTTAITFDYSVPSSSDFTQQMILIQKKYPYLVVESEGKVWGYAYASPWIHRAAYDWCCESSIYIHKDARKQGLGRLLYMHLEDLLSQMGILNIYACIALPETEDSYLTCNSADFHKHLGYSQTGFFRNCGYKFGRWYHMIWMEKFLGTHESPVFPVIPYPELKKAKA